MYRKPLVIEIKECSGRRVVDLNLPGAFLTQVLNMQKGGPQANLACLPHLSLTNHVTNCYTPWMNA